MVSFIISFIETTRRDIFLLLKNNTVFFNRCCLVIFQGFSTE